MKAKRERTRRTDSAKIVWKFRDSDSTSQSLPNYCFGILTTAARLYTSENPAFRENGTMLLKQAADRLAQVIVREVANKSNAQQERGGNQLAIERAILKERKKRTPERNIAAIIAAERNISAKWVRTIRANMPKGT